jgi:dihydrofolate reductase
VLNGKRITLIAALARNRAIGRDGRMPWHLPRELKHFKETTMGKPIIMGRRTWESIGRPLPGRQNIVVTRNPSFRAAGCEAAASLVAAVELAQGEEVMIIGGGELYRAAMDYADRMILTVVDCEPEADTWFPGWREEDWQEMALRVEPAGADNPLAYRVIELARRRGQDETSPAPGTADRPPA